MGATASQLANPPSTVIDRVMLSGTQIRAARALLRWSTQALADAAQIGIATVHRAEAVDDMPGMNARTLLKMKQAFEAAGVEFMDGPYSGDGGPGVRLTKR